jgi:hypothetical protein
MREAVVMAQFTNMVNKRAKTTSETKNLLVELEEKAKRVEEITGERIDNRHMMSVIMGILDTETLKHTAQFQGLKVKAEMLKRKIMEFVNLIGTGKGGPDAMDLGRFEKISWSDMSEEAEGEEEADQGYLNRFGEVCYNCGGKGHYARDCRKPKAKGESKGEYKGKGKGEYKGKSKGKGYFKGGAQRIERSLPRTTIRRLLELRRRPLQSRLHWRQGKRRRRKREKPMQLEGHREGKEADVLPREGRRWICDGNEQKGEEG